MMTDIKFYKGKHKYKYGKTELVSVTTFLKDFFGEFNAKEIARKLSRFRVNKEAKKGVRFWLKQWKEASNHGTRVHRALEEYTRKNNAFMLFCETEQDIEKTAQGAGWLDAWASETFTKKELKEVSYVPELIVYDLEHELAGTIDLMVSLNNKVWLLDWKTNKKIEKKGYKKAKAREPIQELEDCNYSKYALQLSTYSYILESQGYEVQGCILVHIKPESVTPYLITPQEYYKHIEAMLKWQKRNQKN